MIGLKQNFDFLLCRCLKKIGIEVLLIHWIKEKKNPFDKDQLTRNPFLTTPHPDIRIEPFFNDVGVTYRSQVQPEVLPYKPSKGNVIRNTNDQWSSSQVPSSDNGTQPPTRRPPTRHHPQPGATYRLRICSDCHLQSVGGVLQRELIYGDDDDGDARASAHKVPK